MARVVIVYHSGRGHTEALAKAALEGAESVPGVTAACIPAAEAMKRIAELDAADAMIFGCPTYMGSGSSEFKKFMEATSRLWSELRWKDKLAAGFTNSGSQSGDKLVTLIQLAVFAAQHGMLWVSLGLLPGNNASTASIEDLNRLGSFLGAMGQSNVDQGSDVAPPPADRATARHLGARVAALALRFAR
ncbi:MAG TPA: flavodoxin family protein [Planctomycetota bacterium]|jgi:multimeric flavodoxin WrbA|nr:flavodoxin family protein [Planctomycetota bacterium]OQC19929.1 MAG: NAD(P)H dehydrogenase (quinone) [Planctomycetes bacterium ADurb.Bin069]HNR99837.1 flavodoxin family protein [Planctomycetota bacterium]HNU26310.1 flavodoxin family protein [Planctomycetota bacterium]HOE28867.1 flavodoxin family protein [Planctomycetota bacterium]